MEETEEMANSRGLVDWAAQAARASMHRRHVQAAQAAAEAKAPPEGEDSADRQS